MTEFTNNGPNDIFHVCFTGASNTTENNITLYTDTLGSTASYFKQCIYCNTQTNKLCEKGACYQCHKENMCHKELRDDLPN